MKIRTDFVTNSSSSSFVCYGMSVDKLREDMSVPLTEELLYDNPIMSVGGPEHEMIGITPYKLEKNFPDIKISEIREVVAQEINKYFGTNYSKNDIHYLEEGWYQG